ncbi:unnamed protein product [Urochloa decumbens]|uniref:Uncharacterized protein n=1 Tax=Urochloa decumbens TaxID=240449 RepID=A0ABC9CJL5_9POAL
MMTSKGSWKQHEFPIFNTELEEGEFRKDEPFVWKNVVHKDMVASVIKFSSSAQVAVEKGQVNTRQSTSPERGSHQGGTANTSVVQSKSSSIKGQPVNVRQSTSGRICSEKHHQSYSPSFHIRSKERYEKRTRNCFSYHEYHHVLKKIKEVCSERHGKLLLQQNKDRKEFNISLKKLEFKFFQEHACSYRVHYERVIPTARYHRMKLPKLSLGILRKVFRKYMQSQLIKFVKQQINDRNKEKRIQERWIFEATAGYLKKCFDETSLTYSGFEIEKSNLHVYAYSEGEQQLKYLDMQSLTAEIEAIASSRELEESHTNKESDLFQPEPVIENLQSPLETMEGTEHGLSVDAPEETAIVDCMSSQSNYAPTMEFGEKLGPQVAISSPPQKEAENVERSCSGVVTDEVLVPDKAVAADSKNAPPVLREKRRCINPGDDALEGSCSRSQRKFPHESQLESVIENLQSPLEPNEGTEHGLSVDAPEETAIVGSMSSQSNYAPTMEFSENLGLQVVISSPPENEVGNVERSCSRVVTDEALVPDKAVAADSENAPPVSREKRRCINPSDDASEGSCSRSQRKFPHESESNIHETALRHEGPQAERLSSGNVYEMEQGDIAGSTEVSSGNTSSFSQVTEQQNTIATSSTLAQPSTQLQVYDPPCQTADHLSQPFGVNTCSVSTGFASHRALNAQQQSVNQMVTSSMVEHTPESGLQSDQVTNEFRQLLMASTNHTSSSAQVTEQQIASRSFSLSQHLRQQYGDQSCQTSAHQYQPSGRNNYSVRARLDSPRASNVQQQSNNQTTTGSTFGQYMPETRLQSDPLTLEMSRLLMLRDLMAKNHLSKRQQIISECQMEMAECKRKFDEQVHNLEMETLQKKMDIERLQDKICKQQILAETFQVIRKSSTGVASCSQRGTPRRTMSEPNEPSGQQVLRLPSSATTYQSPQPAMQPSTINFLRQPVMTTPQAIGNTLGRSGTNLTHATMGAGMAYHAPPPHLRNFVNLLQPPQGAAASFDRRLQLG